MAELPVGWVFPTLRNDGIQMRGRKEVSQKEV